MMTRLNFTHVKNILIVFTLLVGINTTHAQRECRSILGAHLTPIVKDSPLLWAVEGTMSPGKMTDRKLKSGMAIGALNYTWTKHLQTYVEGGFKNWANSADTGAIANEQTNKNWGMRQVFVDFSTPTTSITAGLQEMTLGDFIILDEKVMGLALNHSFGAISIQTCAGSVQKSFARMGRFCGNRHLYNIINPNFTEEIGSTPGSTNLLGSSISWDPYAAQSSAEEIDEFSEFEEFSEEAGVKRIVQATSLLLYAELGSSLDDNRYYVGSQTTLSLLSEIQLHLETILQHMSDQNALAWITKLHKNMVWNSGATTHLGVGYFGTHSIDTDATFQPLFSNLFVGEIVRLEAVNFPLATATMGHTLPWHHISFKLKLTQQIQDHETSEIDFLTGIELFDHTKITLILSKVDSRALPETIHMVRVEGKVAF